MIVNKNQLVSVIIPAYNIEKYIIECIDSVLHQTYKYLDIIVIDDGSSDSTGELCDQISECDDRLRIIHKPNEGLSAARNTGIDYAKGDFICFTDGDDVLHPEFIERLLSAINLYDLDCAFCSFERFSDKIRTSKEINQNTFSEYSQREMLLILSDITHKERESATIIVNKLYKRDIFTGLRFIEGRIHEDEFIIHRLMGKCHKIGYLRYYGYYYRMRSDSITGNWKRLSTQHLDVVDAYHDRLEYIKETSDNELINKMSISMCEIILMTYFNAWESNSLKDSSFNKAVTIDQYLRKYMKRTLFSEHNNLSLRTNLKYLRFILSPINFYNKYWHKNIR